MLLNVSNKRGYILRGALGKCSDYVEVEYEAHRAVFITLKFKVISESVKKKTKHEA